MYGAGAMQWPEPPCIVHDTVYNLLDGYSHHGFGAGTVVVGRSNQGLGEVRRRAIIRISHRAGPLQCGCCRPAPVPPPCAHSAAG